jgi:ATP-binding cassette subfamily C protein
LKASIGLSKSTLDLADELADQNILLQDFDSINLLTKKGITNGHSKFSPEVVVEKLNFIYPNSKQSVLTNLNLVVNQGDMVAIQGKSGSGKSTLIDLILGILTPTSGKVQISGVDSAKAIRTWPGAIGYVPQNVRIIDGTIRENIAFGVPESLIDDKLIWESLEKAQISDLVTQRSGLETKVGELGFEISGGQSQRIGLARALYTRPKLIILDEATSALDEETENNFLRVLESFRENTSTLIVSHKTSSLNYCNKFLDLN